MKKQKKPTEASKVVMASSRFHIAKRTDIIWWKGWIIRAVAILLALVVCGVVTVALTDLDPLEMYRTMIDGAIGTPRLVWNLYQNVAILLCVALAITLAFKMKFWNIGGEGQILIGGLATAFCIIYFGENMPTWLLIFVMLIASMAAGAIWGLIPAFFKTRFNSNETL